jgi:sulfite exporter TauE/SafE
VCSSDLNGPAAAFGRFVRLFAGTGSAGAYYPLGMVLGFLPCGLVYTVLLSCARKGMEAASTSGAFLSGFLLMAVFGLGTVPSLLLLGKAVSLSGGRIRTRRRCYRAAAALMVVLGIVFAVRGVRA